MAVKKLAYTLINLVTILVVNDAMVAKAQDGTFTKAYSESTFTPYGVPDYEATAFVDNVNGVTKQRIWWCGYNGAANPYANYVPVGDSILYSEEYNSGPYSAPQIQITWNGNYGKLTNVACSPTVVRLPTDGSYRMFYECTWAGEPIPSSGLPPANLCAAWSSDGYNWSVWNGGGWVPQWYGVAQPFLPSPSNMTGYGVGHPSAVIVNNEIWLYYFLQVNAGGPVQTWRARIGGANYTQVLEYKPTNLTTTAYHVYVLGTYRGTFFLATYGGGDGVLANHYLTSSDGINFEPIGSAHPLAYASRPCAVSPPAILSNIFGQIVIPNWTPTTMVLFSSEGLVAQDPSASPACWVNFWEPVRGSTWDVYPVVGYFQW